MLVLFFLTASLITMDKSASAVTTVENSWETRAPMQVARSNLGVAEVNDRIYAIGGNAKNAVSINEEFNPVTDTWTFKKPMPTPMSSFATAVYLILINCSCKG